MVKIIVGLMGSSVQGGSQKLSTASQFRSLLVHLKDHNVRELDTARVYNNGRSEELLGEALTAGPSAKELTAHFGVQTKAPGFSPGSLTARRIIDNCNASLKALQQDRIDLYYFHGPDRQTPLEESCRAIQQLYREGKFIRWGVSNMHADEVDEIVDICHKNDWITPSVYQGGYNALSRPMEAGLLPTLRKYNMVFYAYSPLAGGFFGKPVSELLNPSKGGRMDEMKIFQSMYINELSIKLLKALIDVCDKEGVAVKDAALRWLMNHSALGEEDGVVLGGASLEQIEENVKACKGQPLPQSILDSFESMWTQWRDAGMAPHYCIPK